MGLERAMLGAVGASAGGAAVWAAMRCRCLVLLGCETDTKSPQCTPHDTVSHSVTQYHSVSHRLSHNSATRHTVSVSNCITQHHVMSLMPLSITPCHPMSWFPVSLYSLCLGETAARGAPLHSPLPWLGASPEPITGPRHASGLVD